MEGLTNVNDIFELFWGNPRRKAVQGDVLKSSSAAFAWSALCFLLLGIITFSLSSVKLDSANPYRVSRGLFLWNNAGRFLALHDCEPAFGADRCFKKKNSKHHNFVLCPRACKNSKYHCSEQHREKPRRRGANIHWLHKGPMLCVTVFMALPSGS